MEESKVIEAGNKYIYGFVGGKWQPANSLTGHSIVAYGEFFNNEADCQKECDRMNVMLSGSPRKMEINVPVPTIGGMKRELKYHSSWEWIMPACKKFHELNLEGYEYEQHCESIDIAVTSYEIERAFKKLSEAITWYNTSSNPKQVNK